MKACSRRHKNLNQACGPYSLPATKTFSPKTKSSSLEHISMFLTFLNNPLFTYYTLIHLKLSFSIFSFYNLFPKSLLLYSWRYSFFPLKFNLFYSSRSFPTFNTLKCRNAVNLSLSTNPHPPQLHSLQAWPPKRLVLIFLAHLHQFVSSPCSFLLTDVTAPSSSLHHLQQHSRLLRLRIEHRTIGDSEITSSVYFQSTFGKL